VIAIIGILVALLMPAVQQGASGGKPGSIRNVSVPGAENRMITGGEK